MTRLLEGRQLLSGVLWNLLAVVIPLAAAGVAFPVLISLMGTDRFGILGIVWVVIGYLGLLDLGLGRALTKLTAERLGQGRDLSISALVWTAVLVLALVGVVSGVALWSMAVWLVEDVLAVPGSIRGESILAFRIVSLSLPVVLVGTALRGVVEAHQRFDLVTAVQAPYGAISYLGPVLVSAFSPTLPLVVGSIAAARAFALLLYAHFVRRVAPGIRPSKIDFGELRNLLSLGGWMTTSSAIVPIMTYADRFYIGAVLGTTAVAHYTVPYEIATRVWIIPMAIMGVMFPAFSAASAQKDREQTDAIFRRSLAAVAVSLFVLLAMLSAVADPLIGAWIGQEFASVGGSLFRILAVGVFANGCAQVAFGLVQAVGRADLTAKMHIIQLPLYAVALWFLVENHGLLGVALAWTGRTLLNTSMLYIIVARISEGGTGLLRRAAPITVVGTVALIGTGLTAGVLRSTGYFLTTSGIVIYFVIKSVLLEGEARYMMMSAYSVAVSRVRSKGLRL